MIRYCNGLRLPDALCRAIALGICKAPSDRNAWRTLFPDDEIVRPHLYEFSDEHSTDSWLASAGPQYIGSKNDGCFPGDIDPSRAVLIADLGPDRLIALDYRESEERPRVIGLTTDDDYWRLVADDIESFMLAIGISIDSY